MTLDQMDVFEYVLCGMLVFLVACLILLFVSFVWDFFTTYTEEMILPVTITDKTYTAPHTSLVTTVGHKGSVSMHPVFHPAKYFVEGNYDGNYCSGDNLTIFDKVSIGDKHDVNCIVKRKKKTHECLGITMNYLVDKVTQ